MKLLRPKEAETPKRPFILAAVILSLVLVLLAGRLWYLQLVQGDYFQDLSEHNRIRLQDIPSARGMIFDRNGLLMVDNEPAFDLALIREDMDDEGLLLTRLKLLLGVEPDTVREKLAKAKEAPPFVPITIKTDLTWEELARVETCKYETPGLSLQIEPRRYYFYPSLAAHLIGYTGEVSSRQLAKKRYQGVRMGDRVGQSGIEQVYQDVMAGQRGGRQVEVDATGRPLKVLKEVPAKPGSNIFLTVDVRLQRAAEEALGDKSGSVVALDPNNGQILALVSRPNFDQSAFVRGLSPKEWKKLTTNSLHPLENRAISGQYPPGSTYKIVVAIAGLMEGVITPSTTHFCPGFYNFGGRPYHCWKKGGHGAISLHRALVESCDVYFYRVGQELGVDRIAKWANVLGLGQTLGLDIGPEKPGLIPTASWKKRRFGIPWQKGETLSIAIGQGFNLVTPLQMASLTAAVVNGGKLWQPQVVLKIERPNGEVSQSFKPILRSELPVKPWVLATVRRALADVVADPHGTGRQAKVEGMTVGGKTGTAQVTPLERFKDIKDIEKIPYKYRDHAWFVAFAPVEKPEIAVAVVAEHGGHGGSAAAPVAQKVIEAFKAIKQKQALKADVATQTG